MIQRLNVDKKFIPLLATIGIFLLMFIIGSISYTGFFSLQNLLNFLIDNAFLCITAIGMTFVLIAGGIDLSVGSVIALTTMVSAYLLEVKMINPFLVILIVLCMGAAFGAFMGAVIHFFQIQPFIVTLAGLFLARGLCYLISIQDIIIQNATYKAISNYRIPFIGGTFVSVNVVILFLVILVSVYLAHYTKFGRTVYAIGGDEQSAVLMGLPVARTKILIYTLSGLLSSLGGVAMTFYMLSGYGLHGLGLELDAIAAVVIGGTLLTGGVGYVVGTVFGVLIIGTIQQLIIFQGNINTWWTKIIIGVLLFIFILLQRLFNVKEEKA